MKTTEILTAKQLFENRKFFENENIKVLAELTKEVDLLLTGGAVLDILNGVEPKDYDFFPSSFFNTDYLLNALYERGAELQYTSKTAYTFNYKRLTVQVLKTHVDEFDYTINASQINLHNKHIAKFDMVSYMSGILIPTEHSFQKGYKSVECIKRLPKMQERGFSLPIITERTLKRNYSFLTYLLTYFSDTKS